jgi:hypothetical protein
MTMLHRTKRWTEDLQIIATKILSTSGADVSQGVAIRPLARAMVKILGCSYQSAIRHVEQAILRARDELKSAQQNYRISTSPKFPSIQNLLTNKTLPRRPWSAGKILMDIS